MVGYQVIILTLINIAINFIFIIKETYLNMKKNIAKIKNIIKNCFRRRKKRAVIYNDCETLPSSSKFIENDACFKT